ncbi:MAG: hypothetical protein MUP44_11765 [Anaerolineales bacterium]|nr:hypothetical protein [Anaerolineales bacterium]
MQKITVAPTITNHPHGFAGIRASKDNLSALSKEATTEQWQSPLTGTDRFYI